LVTVMLGLLSSSAVSARSRVRQILKPR
jgi:hypothetical protein